MGDAWSRRTPSVSASPFSDVFFFSFVSFSPISPPLIKYDFRPLCGNMHARPSTWSKHPQPASSEPGDTWLMPRCRRPGVGGGGRSGGRQLADELQVIPREGLSQKRGCHLHFQDGKPLLCFEYEVKPQRPLTMCDQQGDPSPTSTERDHKPF